MDREEREEEEVKFFMLHMFEFIYQLLCIKLPEDLQTELDCFPKEETNYFTDTIAKALFILMNERDDDGKEISSAGSLENTGSLSVFNYPLEFLEFCSSYIRKAALDPSGDTSKSYQELCSATEMDYDNLNHIMWDRLEEVASQVIVKNYIQCRRLPYFNPKKKLNLDIEKDFVLRLMQQVFCLLSSELPEYYIGKLRKLDEKNYYLTENVQKAVCCVVDSQQITSKGKEETNLRHWYRFSFNSFNAKEFLEYCVFLSRYAFEDYYIKKKTFTPYKVHELCVRVLQGVKDKGLPAPWKEIDNAAISILKNNEGLHEDKNDVKCEVEETRQNMTSCTITESVDSSRNVTYNSDCRCSMCSFMCGNIP